MTVPRPRNRPIKGPPATDEAMESFTLRLPRWSMFGLFRRNPLLRASDRIVALATAVAVTVSVLAIPVAAAVGTAVHDSRRDAYAQQQQSRHVVTATITDDTAAQKISRTNTVTVDARWSTGGTEHSGAITAPSAVEPGDHVAIWVDDSGAVTDEPTPTTRAGVDAVTAALFMWAGVTAIATILLAGIEAACNRIRAIGWQNAIDTLIDRDGQKHGRP
jgi:hypothetical protein